MAWTSVLNCFQVLVNEIACLIESNLAIFDLTWNLLIDTFFIFKTGAIGRIMVILHRLWGHFNTISTILSIFHGVDIWFTMHYDGYHNNSISMMIKSQCIILILIYGIKMMILLLFYHFVCVFILYCSVTMEMNGYDYRIKCNILCKNENFTIDKYNCCDKLFDISDCMFYCICIDLKLDNKKR